MSASVEKSVHFNPRLESVRGLAALMVAGYHSFLVYDSTGVSHWILVGLGALFNGHAAVTVFFVLSGIVLGMGLQRAGQLSGSQFAVFGMRRLFRIYPVFFLTTTAIVVFLFWARFRFGDGYWFNHALPFHSELLNSEAVPATDRILRNYSMVDASLNFVTWTLGIELFASLFLAVAHYLRLRFRFVGLTSILVLSVAALFFHKSLQGTFFSWINYFFLFWLGYMLPLVGPRIFHGLRERRGATGFTLLLSLALLLAFDRRIEEYRIIEGVAAFSLLGVLLYGFPLASFRFLDLPVIRFYGRISYSFYLVHDLVLVCLARIAAHFWFGPANSPLAIVIDTGLLIVSVAIATVIAFGLYQTVEKPFIQLGKRFAGGSSGPKPQFARNAVEPVLSVRPGPAMVELKTCDAVKLPE